MSTMHALLIAVNRYHHLQPLRYAVADARRLSATLISCGYEPANVRILMDEEATRPQMIAALEQLAGRAGPADTVVVAMSMHGGRTAAANVLCPIEADPERVAATCLSSDELTQLLARIRAERLLVLLDCCHGGGLAELRIARRGVTLIPGLSSRAYKQLAGRGRAIMAACRPEEQALELPELGHGLFTYHLDVGLRGGARGADGAVRLSGLYGYTYEHVSRHANQHPFLRANTEDFVVAQLAAGAKSAASAAQGWPVEFRVQLREMIAAAFTGDELEILLADLGLAYDDLPGATRRLKVLHLVDRYHRRGLLGQLLEAVGREQPQMRPQLVALQGQAGVLETGRQSAAS